MGCSCVSLLRAEGTVLADAFSMFDFCGEFGLVGVPVWLTGWSGVGVVVLNLSVWAITNNVEAALLSVGDVLGKLSGKGRSMYGHGLFCLGIFVYYVGLNAGSLFPYSFSVSSHFSHNLSMSLAVWVTLIIVSCVVSFDGSLASFVPESLPWMVGGPVALFETISIFCRSITLGARLTMNVIAGKLLICIGLSFLSPLLLTGGVLSVSGLFLLVMMFVLVTWEMVVGLIQSFIFTFLMVMYFDEVSF
uniref:ATP synthase subunit a n=1 Tax=Macoma balthica TaxID=1903275 RepID=A0A6H2U273_MACBL|nr:ATP synthase F0 subunit 6 [Macoma balthica]